MYVCKISFSLCIICPSGTICEKKGINLIINLGDFFGFRTENISDYDKYIEGRELVTYLANYFPKREGIYHAILGGNHDEDSLKYGYDSIDLLSKEREDIINLGYTHALVTFNGVKSPLSSLLLHHIDRRIKDPVSYKEYDETDYKGYLDNYTNFDQYIVSE